MRARCAPGRRPRGRGHRGRARRRRASREPWCAAGRARSRRACRHRDRLRWLRPGSEDSVAALLAQGVRVGAAGGPRARRPPAPVAGGRRRARRPAGRDVDRQRPPAAGPLAAHRAAGHEPFGQRATTSDVTRGRAGALGARAAAARPRRCPTRPRSPRPGRRRARSRAGTWRCSPTRRTLDGTRRARAAQRRHRVGAVVADAAAGRERRRARRRRARGRRAGRARHARRRRRLARAARRGRARRRAGLGCVAGGTLVAWRARGLAVARAAGLTAATLSARAGPAPRRHGARGHRRRCVRGDGGRRRRPGGRRRHGGRPLRRRLDRSRGDRRPREPGRRARAAARLRPGVPGRHAGCDRPAQPACCSPAQVLDDAHRVADRLASSTASGTWRWPLSACTSSRSRLRQATRTVRNSTPSARSSRATRPHGHRRSVGVRQR